MRLENKVAIITGAASGIGRATALLFAQEGARLVLIDRDAPTLAALAAELPPQKTLIRPGDVATPGQAETDTAAALTHFNRIDILVTAAGFSSGGTALTIRPEDWDAVLRTNLTGTWLWARAVLPTMIAAKSGSIVTIASQLARAGGRNNVAYIASKGAIISLTKTMALDHVADGIRVNTILPGAIDTPLLTRSMARAPTPAAARAASLARHPMHRFGHAPEIAEAALYLASDASSFTTGTELVVDGGWLAA